MNKIVDYTIRVRTDNDKVFGVVGGRVKALQIELINKFPIEEIEFFKSYKGEDDNQDDNRKIRIDKS